MDSIVSIAAFYILAAVTVGSAVLVVAFKNLVHSVLVLAISFLGVAGFYLMLNASFIAMVQILVYAGAVCIMVVFGIMLTQQGGMSGSNGFNKQIFASGGVVALLIAVIAYLGVNAGEWQISAKQVPHDTVGNIAVLMLSKYMIPFEVAALLLLVALIGAVVLAKEVKAK
ncbi:NADH-ubiquinone/plastoquinone oxidoreductase chain 6 [Desulfofarcimen acetoxidans DSM 771]|jgi:NADH-quinone oxidoreductase subunit J|uniref:NADH-quinone oxidoreductase subunit J n=1 Tax=Desulfofarcimen acetoxidans (strain ATCC 49208 / DSM 771 / KCTC 5769 / VKM B-1644 / 5575) TaxID=485916 RepID=C8W5B3_DESAS|nr:NADH-quinone oxidoreductase subunit J [Desulfofarcimen acetoxidans]ACV62095.1 NADH-ubiquinone/plastoquinone oxidoreductase chain 6 [Desulfofarcimen acetoxidans DSM 771]